MDHYEFKKSKVTCEHCGWEGLGQEATTLELFNELAEYGCPRCNEKIAVVMYPTTEESRANWSELSPLEQEYVERIEAGRREFAERSLKSADQLPDMALPAFALLWDSDGPDFGAGDTVIRHGDRILWREPEVYEGYWRFMEIVQLLRTRYGTALQDVEPTQRSHLYLYGDQLGSVDGVVIVRNDLRKMAAVPLPPLGIEE